jgi:hypothetical protein
MIVVRALLGGAVGGPVFFAVWAALFGYTTAAVVCLAVAVFALFLYVNVLAVDK